MEVKNAVFYDSAKAQLDLVKQKVEALRAEVASLGGDTSEADQALQTIDTKLQLVETDVTNGVTANFTLRAEWQAKRHEIETITQKIKALPKEAESDAGKHPATRSTTAPVRMMPKRQSPRKLSKSCPAS